MSDHDTEKTNPRLLTEPEAAEWLHQSLSTLRRWRRQRVGPAFVRFGRVIFYQPNDLDIFIAKHRCSQEVQ